MFRMIAFVICFGAACVPHHVLFVLRYARVFALCLACSFMRCACVCGGGIVLRYASAVFLVVLLCVLVMLAMLLRSTFDDCCYSCDARLLLFMCCCIVPRARAALLCCAWLCNVLLLRCAGPCCVLPMYLMRVCVL